MEVFVTPSELEREMSKAKKKKIKQRKHEIRMAQRTAERVVSAIEGKTIKFKEDIGKRIKG